MKQRGAFLFLLAVALAAMAGALIAAEVPGFALYRSAELKGWEKKLSAKVDAGKSASQQLDRFGNHFTMIGHREGDGMAELHELNADFFVVESGEATLIVGGRITDAKTTAPHEVRGPSIAGGEKHKLEAGDVVHIAPNTPHQLLVPAGKQFTYFVIKVEAK